MRLADGRLYVTEEEYDALVERRGGLGTLPLAELREPPSPAVLESLSAFLPGLPLEDVARVANMLTVQHLIGGVPVVVEDV